MHVKYLILGAGPSGLTIARSLLDSGVANSDIRVLEREKVPGGLCRSMDVDGSPLDVGGGHFLDVRRQDVLSFIFRFLPREEWIEFDRKATILINGREVDHPLEANIWRLTAEEQVEYLEAIAKSGSVRGMPMPTSFVDWVTWKLGDRIAKDYMLPYNQKIWSIDLSQIGTYWLHKLPSVSFTETLRSCLERKPFGSLPAHGKFLYPKSYGYGEVWKRIGHSLADSLVLDCPVRQIDLGSLTVNRQWQADTIINTIPWTEWLGIANLPRDVESAIDRLKYVTLDVDYHEDPVLSSAHWIYEPRLDIPYHRILVRSNFRQGARGYWTEANAIRSIPFPGFRHRSQYAYPINTVDKPKVVDFILNWARPIRIFATGRWGMWDHVNSDVAVADAMNLAKELL